MGFDEYFYSDGITVVEWADKIKNSLPEEYMTIYIKVEDNIRKLEITYIGDKYKVVEEKLYESFGI